MWFVERKEEREHGLSLNSVLSHHLIHSSKQKTTHLMQLKPVPGNLQRGWGRRRERQSGHKTQRKLNVKCSLGESGPDLMALVYLKRPRRVLQA